MSHTHVTICGVTQQTLMAYTSSCQSPIALMINSTDHKKIFMEEGKYLAFNKIYDEQFFIFFTQIQLKENQKFMNQQ
jgi:hypothetical protein